MKGALHICAFLAVALVSATLVCAGTVTGIVRNGTTGTPAGNQEVILIKLQGGMEPLGTYKTDAQGRFRIDHPEIGGSPLLLRVVYRGVNYHQNLPPGQLQADIEVFEATDNTENLNVASRLIAVQPSGEQLLVAEEFTVHNHSKPPMTITRNDGSFEFWLPLGAELGQVSVTGSSGLPLVQGTVDRGNGRFSINYPFRPGETLVRASFRVAYPQNAATLRLGSPYAVQNVLVVAPPPVSVQGEGFASRGVEQGWNVFGRENVGAARVFELKVAGFAPPPQNDPNAPPPQGAAGGATSTGVSVVPQRLENLKWVLLIGLGALFALGGFLLWKHTLLQPSAVSAGVSGTKQNAGADSAASDAMKQIEQQALGSLDAVKELLLRIEIRKQAGTISEAEYQNERRRAEEMLRKFLG
jgi:hypothetical protein